MARIEIPFSEGDLSELLDGGTHDWVFTTDTGVEVEIHLFNEDAS